MKFKLTSKSYKRKLVTFGILLFSGVSLVSTGFAAWVVSQGSETNNDGNVEVGVVENKSVDIIDLRFTADSSRKKIEDNSKLSEPETYTYESIKNKENSIGFYFDAQFGDNAGMVKYNPEFEAKFECLKIRVDGTVTNASFLDKLQIKLELPKGLQECVDKGYLIAPEGSYYRGDTTILPRVIETMDHPVDSNKKNFSFVIEFKWGNAFLGINPCLYFDEQVGGSASPSELTIPTDATFEEVNAILNELRGLTLGLESNGTVEFDNRVYKTFDKDLLEQEQGEIFKLTIEAIAK